MKASYCVKAFQKVDIAKGTFLPHYRNYSASSKEKTFPVVDFNPVEIYLNELRSAYGELAHFCTDLYGDTKIYVLWKPDALRNKELKPTNLKYRLVDPVKNSLELNLAAVIEDFKIIGGELVESVIVKNESKIFK